MSMVYASALHAGDEITIAGHGGSATVRCIGSLRHGKRALLETTDRPGRLFPVRYLDTELVERVTAAGWTP